MCTRSRPAQEGRLTFVARALYLISPLSPVFMVAAVAAFLFALATLACQGVRAQSCPAAVADALASPSTSSNGAVTIYVIALDQFPSSNWILTLSWPRLQSTGGSVWGSSNNVSLSYSSSTVTARFSVLTRCVAVVQAAVLFFLTRSAGCCVLAAAADRDGRARCAQCRL